MTDHSWKQSKEEANDQESIQSNTTPDPEHHWKVTNTQEKSHTKDKAFPAGDLKAARSRQNSMTNMKRIHKISMALERSGKNTGGLKYVWRRQLHPYFWCGSR